MVLLMTPCHTLTRTAKNTFTYGSVTYNNRTAGDDTTNPQPSFVGQKITDIFFHNNRFGGVSKDNVIMSQPYDSLKISMVGLLLQLQVGSFRISNCSSVYVCSPE